MATHLFTPSAILERKDPWLVHPGCLMIMRLLIFLLESRTRPRKGKSSSLPCAGGWEGRGDKVWSELHDQKPVLALPHGAASQLRCPHLYNGTTT